MKPVRFSKTLLFVLLAAAFAWMAASAAWAAGPTGNSPNDPLMVPTADQTIAPNTTLWFYFDYANSSPGPTLRFGRGRGPSGRPTAQVTVDANGAPGLSMGIFTPAQAAEWMSDPTTTPVGRGTAYRDPVYDRVTHDLYWAGGFNISDRYLIALTNSSAVPITFQMTVTGETVTLYPPIAPSPTPTLPVPFTLTPVPTGTITGKIVFETTTGGDIYTVNGDGSNLTRVTYGIDPTWSPDGKQITFARWDNAAPGIYIANADGSNERLLITTPRARWPRYSPDGKYIVFSQAKNPGSDSSPWKLGVVEVATGHLTEPQCSQQCFAPSWTPDGGNIIYADPGIGILTTNLLQGPATRLGPNATYWDSNANIPRPVLNWPPMQDTEMSPDGTKIAFSMKAQDRWELNTINADGSGQTGITSPDPIASILFDQVIRNVAPTWSPDGQQLLFLSDRNGKWEFFVTDASGQNIKQVLKNVTDRISLQFGYNNERVMDWTK